MWRVCEINSNPDETRELILTRLAEGLPGITPAFGSALAEAGAVCFEAQGHPNGVEMTVEGTFTARYKVYWQKLTDQMRCSWSDFNYTIGQAACGIALLLMRDLTQYTVIDRTRKATVFDYWLGKEEDELSFQNKAHLEVSGMNSGNRSLMEARVRQKLKQAGSSDSPLFPTYIVVVDFSIPLSKVVKI